MISFSGGSLTDFQLLTCRMNCVKPLYALSILKYPCVTTWKKKLIRAPPPDDVICLQPDQYNYYYDLKTPPDYVIRGKFHQREAVII